ncbi:hypothetical protein FRC11_007340 [Ceratobasidium sp. 423]|nr:hypothetical protein FRC11_007340 [Ceratobasidium sp. 423]
MTALPATLPVEAPANAENWKKVLESFTAGQAPVIMTLLKSQEFDPAQIDRVFRRLTNVVQVRFGERQGTEIVNRVHLVPRGRLAMGTVMAHRPKVDVDLVIPSDFILRRWNTTAAETDDLRPKTIADALDLHPTSINRAEVDVAKLRWVFQAIWEQLNGSADGFIFPGGSAEAGRYLPQDWCSLYKDRIRDSNRLRLATLYGANKIVINIFVKVSLSLYGQDMLVGVDQTSAKIGERYQLIKTLRTPGVPLSEPALSPTLRTAIRFLCWSQYILGIVPKCSPIPASHFHIALTALQQLPPSNDLHILPSFNGEPFSLYDAMKIAVKIVTFLGSAYKPPVLAPDGYPFPLSSCTLMDALYLKISSSPVRMAAILLCFGATFPQFQAFEKAVLVFSGGLGSMAGKLAGTAAKDAVGALAGKEAGTLAAAGTEFAVATAPGSSGDDPKAAGATPVVSKPPASEFNSGPDASATGVDNSESAHSQPVEESAPEESPTGRPPVGGEGPPDGEVAPGTASPGAPVPPQASDPQTPAITVSPSKDSEKAGNSNKKVVQRQGSTTSKRNSSLQPLVAAGRRPAPR